MTGKIEINGISMFTTLGVFPEERRAPREVIVDVELELPLGKAAASDDLKDTVDWGDLVTRLRKTAEASSFKLAEALAGALLSECLRDDRVLKATVKVVKPNAMEGVGSFAAVLTSSK